MNFKHFLNLPPLNFSRRPLLGLVTALLLALLTVGCDSSGGDSFVATPGGDNGQGPVGTGSVTFNFVQAQTPIAVPVGTTDLRFEFFNDLGGTGSLVLREDRAFATTITIDGVPTTARSVKITAYDDDGFPISEFTANVTPVQGGNVFVAGSDGTTVPVTLVGISVNPATLSLGLTGSVQLDVVANFSNGESVPVTGDALNEVTFVSDDASTASVSPDGTVSAVLAGQTFITVSFRGFDTTVPVTVSTGNNIPPLAESLTVSPTTVTLPRGTMSNPLVFTVTFATGEVVQVGAQQGVIYTTSDPGITVTEDDQIVIGGNVNPGAYTVTGSFAGLQAAVAVTVSSATLDQIQVAPATVSLPYGGFEQQLVVTGSFSDQTSAQIDPALLTFSPSSTGNFDIDADGLLVTTAGGTAGTDTVTITHTSGLSTSAEVSVGLVTINSLTISPSSLTLNAGEFADVTVTANLSNGQNVVVTDFASLEASASNSNVVVNGSRVVAVNPGSSSVVTYTIQNAGPNGTDAIGTLNVTILTVTLDSATIFFAGNAIDNSVETVNLPRGYVGIFEVEGTYSNGTTRKLRPEEYSLSITGGARNPEAIQLFDTNYTIRVPDTIYTDDTNEGTANTVDEIVNDFLGTPRVADSTRTASNDREFAVSDDYRGVVADWYRGDFVDGRGNIFNYSGPFTAQNPDIVAPDSSADVLISINDNSDLNRTVSVTITDQQIAPVSIASVSLVNYPGDPNVVVGTPRELDVRVNFPGVSILNQGGRPYQFTLPPYVSAQTNFKLAEANVEFSTDDLPDTPGGQIPAYTDVLHHVASEVGFIGITSDVPVNVGLLNVAAVPVGGRVAAPVVEAAPEFTIGTGSASNPNQYSPASYGTDNAVFGVSSPFNVLEDPAQIFLRDPGPASVNNVSVAQAKASRQPADFIEPIYNEFNNNGAGFRVVNPVLFTLDPANSITLEVGESQIFRTLVRFTSSQVTADDRSQDYPPTLELNPDATVGVPSSTSGQLTVSGVVANAADIITALDIQGVPIPAVGTGSSATCTVTVTIP